ncbi:MAG: hypothetical protein MK213_07080, partial [Planctomycetes bacterium]|nr:hypothetical protein [Planctomycetota bacterium]
MRLAPFRKLFIITALCLAGCEGGGTVSSRSASFEVHLENTGAQTQTAGHQGIGIPLIQGQFDEIPSFSIEAENQQFYSADHEVMARWPDGSVRWAWFDFWAPSVAAGEEWHARFEVQEHPTTPPGQLHVNPPNGNRSWLLDNGELRVQVSSHAGELFRIDGNTSALRQMPLTMELKSQQEAFTLSADPPVVSIERQGRWAATVKRQDTWVDSDGLPTWNITTRLTLFRASKKVRLQQSVDLVRGTHKMEQWSLGFPATGNASVHLLLPDESLAELQGDFRVRQTAADTWRKDGVDYLGELPGVLQVGSIAFGLSQFRNLFPSGFRRENDLFHFEFCTATDRRVLALEEGFGRTRELWIEMAPPGEQVHAQEFSQAFNYPAIAHASPSQYIASGAFGSMGEALSGDHPALEQALATSVDAILARRESYSDYDIGLIGFGDDFAGRKNASYWGALQQEYDPMSVLFQQFARTGAVGFLRPAMDSAWHYADVDIAPYGGAFQHRSPVHHLETWIAHEMSAALASEATASPYWDGTVHGLLAWVDAVYEEGFRQKMEGWLEHEQRSGANADELQKRGLLMVACNEINAMLPELTINGK